MFWFDICMCIYKDIHLLDCTHFAIFCTYMFHIIHFQQSALSIKQSNKFLCVSYWSRYSYVICIQHNQPVSVDCVGRYSNTRRALQLYPELRDLLSKCSNCAVCDEAFLNTWLECVRFVDGQVIRHYTCIHILTLHT